MDGRLLYVGCSLSAVARLAQHRDHATWFADIARVEIEKFPTREAALKAEVGAIVAEQPAHNIKHKKPPAVFQPAEHSRQQLIRSIAFEPLYSVVRAAGALNVSDLCIRRLIDRGHLAFVLIGTRRYITGWQLIDYLEYLQATGESKK